ncbi:MAG: glycosyltransferase family 2 protein [Desulfobacteraceae bacterium]|nr:glycosyltransferase family 2 protein [Desulfobacteraceae bacterium]MBU3948103.1 glycosyltransferase family 2 protein [Pseudomonadota bacterium]
MTEMVTPNVFCVIPVHNRIAITRQCIEYLAKQDYPAIQIIVVDDGSTDGTGEYLTQCELPNLTVLKGDGNLWWGGAMHMGIKLVADLAQDTDYLLMLNDDVRIETNFTSSLVNASAALGGAVVGAQQRDEATREPIGYGYRIDFWGMRFIPLDSNDDTMVDALPGRGVLFPYRAVASVGNLNKNLFPHYLADLEYTSRVREKGWQLVVSKNVAIFTSQESSDKVFSENGWFIRYLSWKSKDCIIVKFLFFSLRGPWPLRILALPRFILVNCLSLLKYA